MHLSQYPLSKLESATVCFRATQPSFVPLTDHLGLDSLSCCQILAVYVGPQPMNQAGGTHRMCVLVPPYLFSKPLPISAIQGAQIHDSLLSLIYLLITWYVREYVEDCMYITMNRTGKIPIHRGYILLSKHK